MTLGALAETRGHAKLLTDLENYNAAIKLIPVVPPWLGEASFQDLLQQHVLGKVVTGQIVLAVTEHATKITFGLPPGIGGATKRTKPICLAVPIENGAEVACRRIASLQRVQ